ncbi:MAG TPA: hypothetical protein VEO96_08580 [Thermoplasmata archaeon]|nr:hypothetical protein [Thermoplasmata archaeon]
MHFLRSDAEAEFAQDRTLERRKRELAAIIRRIMPRETLWAIKTARRFAPFSPLVLVYVRAIALAVAEGADDSHLIEQAEQDERLEDYEWEFVEQARCETYLNELERLL